MTFTPELVHELNALLLFKAEDNQQGVKVHKTALPEVIDAMRRLHAKTLITQVDGGYLTPIGREAQSNALVLLGLLNSGLAAQVK